jgi:hypothetical protein
MSAELRFSARNIMPSSTFSCLRKAGSRLHFNLVIVLGAALLMSATAARAQTVFTTPGTSGAITATGVNASASSTLSVSGATGSVKTIYVTLNGVTSDGLECCDSVYFTSFVLESPGGTKMVLLGGTGDSIDGDDSQDSGSGLKNSTIVIEDGKPAAPDGVSWQPQGASFTVEPSSYWLLPNENGPSFGTLPSDINGDKLPQTDGTSSDGPDTGDATLNGTFANDSANGTWTLYILTDDSFGSNDVVSVSGWSLTMTFNAAADGTGTSVVSNTANPASTSSAVTYMATVLDTTNPGTTVSNGSVTFSANGSTICSSIGVSGGTASCTATLSNQGLYAIQADYSGSSQFDASTSSNIEQLVEHPSTEPTTNKWCNTDSLTVPGQSIALAYPSVIKVSGYPSGTTVGNVGVEFENVTGVIDAQSLLVAPNGTSNLDFFDNGFNQGDSASSGVTLNFEDSAGVYPDPNNGPTGGDTYNYEASDTLDPGNTDTFPSSSASSYDASIPSVPGTINYGYDPFYPTGRGAVSETFESNFNGAPANGTWALYPYEGDAVTETIGGGWCIALTINPGTPTTTTLTSNTNPQAPQQPVSLTATVKSGSSPVTSGGTVTFLENGTAPQGTSGGDNVVNLSTSTGQAPFTTGALSTTITIDAENGTNTTKTVYEGDYPLSAEYSGDSSDNPSTGDLVQRFDNTTTFSAGSGGSFNACNAGPVLLSNGVEGAFAPNPSNIFVANMPGTLNAVTLTLNGWFTANEDAINFTEALLKGPTSAALDFFSNTGSNSTVLGGTTSPWGNLTFEDAASSNVPSSGNYAPGSYKPTAYQGSSSTDSFTSSSSGFYNAPSTFGYAAPHGTSTFANTFNSTNPNGTWGLFFNTTDFLAAEGAQSGWCLNFTENPVSVSVDLSHQGDGTGIDFVQGETSAQITTVVTAGNTSGPTGDPLGTNPLKVTDNNLNSALTYTGYSGTGWSCTAPPATSISCTNDSAVAEGASYPTLTFNVNVSPSAPASISNSVSVSGAGIANNSGSDTITVDSAPSLALSKSHTGNFTQGSTGLWTITVSNMNTGSATSGTVTVADTLPTGYTLASYTSTSNLWTCGTIGSGSVSCTATPGIAGGSSSTINLTVNVPAGSPTSVSNTALAWGGGDPVHNSSGSAASSNTDSVTVAQVPATITLSSGNSQSATIGTAFGTGLEVTVTDAGGVAISGSSVTFTAPASGASGTFSNSSSAITVSTNVNGLANAGIFTANGTPGSYSVSVTDSPAAPASFSLTNSYVPIPTTVIVSAPSVAYVGGPISFTVTVYDQYSNVDTSYAGTLQFTSTDAAATFPVSSSTLTNGTGTFSVTLNTVGSQTITATDTTTPTLTGTSGSITVTMPYLVVTTNGDTTTGVATNCAVQPAAGTGTGTCSLRDALTQAASLGVGNISFDGTAFSAGNSTTQNTIVLANGTLTIPANTSITGPTSGSGYTLSNLVTLDAAGTAGVFEVESSGVTVSQLVIENGSSEYGGGIFNDGGALTVSNSTFTNNTATMWGGAILNYGTITVTGSTFAGNSAEFGGGIINYVGTTTISDSTFTNNSATGYGGGLFDNDQTTVNSSTFSGNSAGGDGGGIEWGGGASTMANSIVSGNSAPSDPDSTAFDDLGGNQVGVAGINLAPLGNYGGPTQTIIPLPGSPAICGGLAANIPGGLTTDQRGLPNENTTYPGYSSTTPCVDSGAVQTNYTMAFSTQPPATALAGQAITPAPVVSLSESGMPFTASSGPVTMTDGASLLGGTTSEPLVSGAASFSDLTISQSINNDLLIATLPLNGTTNLKRNARTLITVTSIAATLTPSSGTLSTSQTFSWSNGDGPVKFALLLGTSGQGSSDIYDSGITTATSATVTIPDGGVMVYGTLRQVINGEWQVSRYTFMELGAPTPATLTPSSGTLTSSQTFTWNNGIGASYYMLLLGTTGPGSTDIYNSEETTATTATVTIPSNGVTVYGTLRQLINGTWMVTPYTFMEPGTTTPATLSPSSGTLSSSQTFTWNNGAGPVDFTLLLGTTGPGSSDIYNSEVTTATTATVTIPSDGLMVYGTLRQLYNGTWMVTRYTFMELGTPTQATLTPSSGTLSASQTFTWNNGAGPVEFVLLLGTTGPGSTDIYNSEGTTATSATVSIPTNSKTVYGTLRQLINGTWVVTRYTFTEPSPPAS